MSIATALKLATSGRHSETISNVAGAASTIAGIATVAGFGASLIGKMIPGTRTANEYADSMHRVGSESSYAGAESEKLAGSLNSVGSKIVELKNKVKDNAASLLTWGAIGGLTAKALIGLAEGADRAVESYYSMGESFKRTNKGMLRAFKDSWNITLMEEWVEMSAARMNLPIEAVKGLYEKLTRSTRTFYSVSGKIRYDILNDTMKQVVAFSRITGASVDQAADLYVRFTNQFGKTNKQALSGMQTIARAGQLVNEELHDMGKDGGVALEDLVGVINDAATAFDGFSLNIEHLAARSAHAVKIGQELGMTYNQAMDTSKQMTSIFAKPGGFIGFQAGEAIRQQVEDATKGLDDAEARAQILAQKFGVNIAVGRTLDIAAQGPNAQMNVMDITKGTKLGMETQFKMMQDLAKDNRMSLDVMKAFLGGENLSAEQAGDLMQVVTQQGSTFQDFARHLDRSKKETSAKSVIEGATFTPTVIKEWLKTASPALQMKAAAILTALKVAPMILLLSAMVPFALGFFRVFKTLPAFLGKLGVGPGTWKGLGGAVKNGAVAGFNYVKDFAQLAIRHVKSGGVWDAIKTGVSKLPEMFARLTEMFRTGSARAMVRVVGAKEWAKQNAGVAADRIQDHASKVKARAGRAYDRQIQARRDQVAAAEASLATASSVESQIATVDRSKLSPEDKAFHDKAAARARRIKAVAAGRKAQALAAIEDISARKSEVFARISRDASEKVTSAYRNAQGVVTEKTRSGFHAVTRAARGSSERLRNRLGMGGLPAAELESLAAGTVDARPEVVGPRPQPTASAGPGLASAIGPAALAAGSAGTKGPGFLRRIGDKIGLSAKKIESAAESSGLKAGVNQMNAARRRMRTGKQVFVEEGMEAAFAHNGGIRAKLGKGLKSGAGAALGHYAGRAAGLAMTGMAVYEMYEQLVPGKIEDKGLGGTEEHPMAGTRRNQKKLEDREKELETLSAQIDLAKDTRNDKMAAAWQAEYDRRHAEYEAIQKETDDLDSVDRMNTEILEQIENVERLRKSATNDAVKAMYTQKLKELKEKQAGYERKIKRSGEQTTHDKDNQGWLGSTINKVSQFGGMLGSGANWALRKAGFEGFRAPAEVIASKLGIPTVEKLAERGGGSTIARMLGMGARGAPIVGSAVGGVVDALTEDGPWAKKLLVGAGSTLGGILGGAGGAALGSLAGPLGTGVGGFAGGVGGSYLGKHGAEALWSLFGGANEAQKVDKTPIVRPAAEPQGAMAGSYEDQVQRGYNQGGYSRVIQATGQASNVNSNGGAQLVLNITNIQDLIASGGVRVKQDATGKSGGL